MSLPWLQPRKKTTTLIAEKGEMKEEGAMDEGLVSAAEDVLSAIAMKDARALAAAMKSAFQICDAEPHVEGEHLGD